MVTRRNLNHPFFITSEQFARDQVPGIESPRGRLLVVSCRSGDRLARDVVACYEAFLEDAGAPTKVPHLEGIDFKFSDSETCVRLGTAVNGYDAFLFQALFDPTSERDVDQNYMAFLIAARALREWGANHVTGVMPYLAYARQDKPTRLKREPTTAELMADLSIAAGVDRVLTWDPHTSRIRGFYGNTPIDILDSLPLFLEAFERFEGRDDTIAVAPDAGAAKFVTHFSRALDLNSAIASKHRPRPEKAVITEVIGDFQGKRVALVLDDMISSGGTMQAVIQNLVETKGIEEVHIGTSHNLCRSVAVERLRDLHHNYHLQEAIVTNSMPQTEEVQNLEFVKVMSISGELAHAINRIHCNRSVGDLAVNQEARGEE